MSGSATVLTPRPRTPDSVASHTLPAQGEPQAQSSGSDQWERYLRAAPGGTLQGSDTASFRRTAVLHRHVHVPSAPAGEPAERADRRGFDPQEIKAMGARAEDAPPPIDIDIDDLAYAIFGVDPDGDAVSTSTVSNAGLDGILGASAAVIYLLGTVPAGMQIVASFNRLKRLGREREKMRALLTDARVEHAAQPSVETQRRMRALTALIARSNRDIDTERSRFSLAGCSAAIGTFLAGTSALLKLDHNPPTQQATSGNVNNNLGVSDGDDDDDDGNDPDGDGSVQTAVQRHSATLGAVGVGFIGLYGVGTSIQFGVNCVQHFMQRAPEVTQGNGAWDLADVDLQGIIAQHRTRLYISDAAASASYLGIGIGVPMTNWDFVKNLPAGLTLLLTGAAGAMATKFYQRSVLRYHQVMPLLQRMRLDTLPKVYLELGFVAQERDLLKKMSQGLPSVWGLRRGSGSYNELFQAFLRPRLQLEEAYWTRKDDILATDPPSESTTTERAAIQRELANCRVALAEVDTQQRFDESPAARVARLLAFCDANGLLADICQSIVTDGKLRTQVGEAHALNYSVQSIMERMESETPEVQMAIAEALTQKTVAFLAGPYRRMRQGRMNELCDMAMDLHA